MDDICHRPSSIVHRRAKPSYIVAASLQREGQRRGAGPLRALKAASIRRVPPFDTSIAGSRWAALAAFGLPYEGLASACCSAVSVSVRSSESASAPASMFASRSAGSSVLLSFAADALAAFPEPLAPATSGATSTLNLAIIPPPTSA